MSALWFSYSLNNAATKSSNAVMSYDATAFVRDLGELHYKINKWIDSSSLQKLKFTLGK